MTYIHPKKNFFIHIIKEAYRYDRERDAEDEVTKKNKFYFKAYVSAFLAGASLLLSIMNIVNEYWKMLGTTLGLTIGFILCAVMFGVFRLEKVPSALAAVMVAFMFTTYAVRGNNEGFAILWILIVPSISMNYIGLSGGTILGIYYQILLPVLFYTPLRDNFAAFYTQTFMTRFPILYFISFLVSIVLTAQKEFYFHGIREAAYVDDLTALRNRRHYEEMLEKLNAGDKANELAIISVDVNRLKYTNDNMGHEAGDQLLSGAAACLTKAFPDAKAVCRTGGDEFMILSYADKDQLEKNIAALRKSASEYKTTLISGISLAVGYATRRDDPTLSIGALEKKADREMYADKRNFYVSSGLERRKG